MISTMPVVIGSQCKHIILTRPIARLNFNCTLCLIFHNILQIIMLSNCQDALLGTSASGYSCTPECVPGFECVLGHCQRQQCETNCSGDPTKGKEFCASDGNTYDSMCELERAKCELQQDITVEYTGACK